MKLKIWEVRLAVSLVLFSIIVYTLKFIMLGDPKNTYLYVFNALGFLPINVLLVTLILNKLLSVRAKRERLEKLNMVIGMFFSEMGTQLLTYISNHDPNLDKVKKQLIVSDRWSGREFSAVGERLKTYSYKVDMAGVDLAAIQCWLDRKKDFMLRLLENPVLLEHESFTELLRAVVHFTEELGHRKELTGLPASDLQHLGGDINRVYSHLAGQWLKYMQYLKDNYPFLFSLAMRTNPFDEKASPIVS